MFTKEIHVKNDRLQNLGYILIVDDSLTNLSVISQALTDAGINVQVARGGKTALEIIASQQPELILLDIQMPDIDGYETCIKLQSNPDTAEIPIIFMTAMTDTNSKVKALSLGAVDYITKPFEPEEVLARVKVHLKIRNLTRTLAEKNAILQELATALEQRVEERAEALQQAQIKLIQQEKLSTLGQLVAGVAHEINNPVNFIYSNIHPAKEHLAEISKFLLLYQKHYPQPVPEISAELENIDLNFVVSDMFKLLDSMKLGTERIKNISISLRNFSRSDTVTKVPTNLHEGIDSTLLILQHRLKGFGKRPTIQVIKNYGDIPPVECNPGQINQVFMNILANAIDALEEERESDSSSKSRLFAPQIRISTDAQDADYVVIRIADNGSGMVEQIRQRIFEPMFTTKALGKGTGLGLSICRQIVEEKHGGKLDCISTPGSGTEFAIQIPLQKT